MHFVQQTGFSMIEVLVTILILAFGLLGLAGFQMQAQMAEMESYQRAQALVLLDDMAQRLTANRNNAGSYVTTDPLGTGNSSSEDCTTAATPAARDQCEWSNTLKGSAASSGSTKIGSMIGARGCITQTQAANPASGVCTPASFRIDVVWQGLTATAAPAAAITCGSGVFGDDRNRRAVSWSVTVGLPGCI